MKRLPLCVFMMLLSIAAGAAEEELTTAASETIPYAWSFTGARYVAEAGGMSVRVKAQFDVSILQEGWVELPIVSETAAPVALRVDGAPAPFGRLKNGFLQCMLRGTGTHAVECEFLAPISRNDGKAAFSFACPKTPATVMTLHVKEAGVTIESEKAIDINPLPNEGESAAELAFAPGDTLMAAWQVPIPEPPPLPVVQAQFECTVNTLVTFEDQCAACTSSLVFKALRGEANLFRFSLPPGINILRAAAESATSRTSVEEERQVVEVSTSRVVGDNVSVEVVYELPYPEKGPLRAVLPTALDVVRQSGYLAVTARASAEIAPGSVPAAYAPLETAQTPAVLRALSSTALLHAFKYAGTPEPIAFDVTRLDTAPIRVANVDRCALETTCLRDGITMTHARYVVRNNIKQFMRIVLPKGAELLSAEVDGNVVRPVREPGTQASLIPLLASAVTGRKSLPFPVDVFYLEKRPPLAWRPGAITFDAPVIDILATEMAWTVFLPESANAWQWGGVFQRGTFSAGALSRADMAHLEATADATQRMTIARLRDSGVTPPAASAAKPEEPAAQISQPALATMQPAKMLFPREGRMIGFRRSMVPEETPITLKLFVAPQSVFTGARIALYAICLLGGLFIGRKKLPQGLSRRAYTALGVANGVVMLFLHHHANGALILTAPVFFLGGVLLVTLYLALVANARQMMEGAAR